MFGFSGDALDELPMIAHYLALAHFDTRECSSAFDTVVRKAHVAALAMCQTDDWPSYGASKSENHAEAWCARATLCRLKAYVTVCEKRVAQAG